MRDAHRLKEKYDLSLDSRQVVSLVIVGLVVLGAAFVLGVVVGKKLSADGRTDSAPDLLSALDAKASTPLTFHEELTQKTPALPSPPPPPAAAQPTVQAEAPAEETPPAKALEPVPEAAKPEPALAEIAKPEAPDEPVPTAVRAGALHQAFERAQKPPSAANGAFSLQLSASQDRAEAERLVAKLRGEGYSPYIISAEVPGRGTWFRVRMGSFASKEAATEYLKDFRRETQYEAFVASN